MKVNFAFVFGFVFGLAIVAFAAWILGKFFLKKSFVAEYDERQNAARGTAFKYGFYTMLAGNMAVYVYHLFSDNTYLLDPVYTDIILVILGLLVYASVSIWKNAYVGINQTVKRSVWLLLGIGVMNIGIGVMNSNLSSKHVMSISYYGINFALGTLLVVICIEMLIKNRLDSAREEEADDDDDDLTNAREEVAALSPDETTNNK